MDFALSQDQKMVRDMVREFAEKELEPIAAEIDESREFPVSTLKKMAGLGLMGVATDGEVALCHRFAGSSEHSIGTVQDGVDEVRKYEFLKKHHIAGKTDCHTCWARPICSGGCYHEAHTRYGSTSTPNLHFCTWVRSWTNTCLEIYGEISERRPDYLAQFDPERTEQRIDA